MYVLKGIILYVIRSVDSQDDQGGLEFDSDNDNVNNSKIESTKAEEEAIEKGLQVLKITSFCLLFPHHYETFYFTLQM